jgi:hypothetical protein
MQQITSTILMVRPANFGFNEETASNNAFQTRDDQTEQHLIRKQACTEFDRFVEALRDAGVRVLVAEDTLNPVKPDAVFPNNWVTFHEDGTVVTYPMYAQLRRLERREDILEQIADSFEVKRRIHLEGSEADEIYLEGTGSMILDRPNRLVYACLSPRTDELLLDRFCTELGFNKRVFQAVDGEGQDIYHTNVMMALGETLVVICLETVRNASEKQLLLDTFRLTGKEVVEISLDQMMAFAGNMLQVRNEQGNPILVMSTQAFESLSPDKILQIEKHCQILHSDIRTIERLGGGSARCMMAEVFLSEKV